MASRVEQLIVKYPKIFKQYEGNPGMVNWLDLPSGWVPIIDMLCNSIQNYVDNFVRYTKDGQYRPQQVTCVQMKEKFGGLRFYTDGNDEHVDGMIYMAEVMAYNTCQDCSSQEDIGRTQGWITTLCRNCAIGNGDRAMNSWEPLNKAPNANI
jgi:hypothetical protein